MNNSNADIISNINQLELLRKELVVSGIINYKTASMLLRKKVAVSGMIIVKSIKLNQQCQSLA